VRYYNIQIGTPSASTALNSLGAGGGRYTSHPNGPGAPPDPGALGAELDLLDVGAHFATGQSWVRIWGVGLSDIAQARNLNPANGGGIGLPITVSGGMGKGLPLANPAQAGVLIEGSIWQAFGNWQGVKQSLDLNLIPGSGRSPPLLGDQAPPVNISFNWMAGTALSTALANALKTAFPNYKQKIAVSPKLVRANTETASYHSLTEFSHYLQDISTSIIKTPGYLGVTIGLNNDTITVSDGTQSFGTPKNILFTDLVGQPTWIGLIEIQVSVIMRGDLNVMDQIKLPAGQVTTTAASLPSLRQGSVFQGTFQILRLHHVGNSRQPEGEAWITTIDAVQVSQS